MWLNAARKAGLTFYISDQIIGKVSFDESSWFTGFNEKFFFAKGAYYQAVHPRTIGLWKLYFSYRTRGFSDLKFSGKMRWMKNGSECYRNTMSYDEFIKIRQEKQGRK